MKREKILGRIRLLIWFVIFGLMLSGITAFPLTYELHFFNAWLQHKNFIGSFSEWINRVAIALEDTDEKYPFMAYGTDWLAFAHIMIALVFIGPLKDPVANRWVIDWGLITCISVIPLALIAGSVREIPFFHQLIDCSFGVIGFILLFYCRNLILQLTSKSLHPHE